MTKRLTTLALLFELAFFISCGQNSKPKPADKFLNFLNNYQVDSLQSMTAENFLLKRTYINYTNDKKSFIDKYIPFSRNVNGKFKILNTTGNHLATDYLVEDHSDYFKYLKIDYPKWKIRIISNANEKIEAMIVDTTEDYRTYLTQSNEKGDSFSRWLKEKYPGETTEVLNNTNGLFIKRLEEYAKNN